MEQLQNLESLKKLSKIQLKKEILRKPYLLLYVSLAYNILAGNIKIKNSAEITKYKKFLSKLGSLEAGICEKRRLILKTTAKTIKETLNLLLGCLQNGKVCSHTAERF